MPKTHLTPNRNLLLETVCGLTVDPWRAHSPDNTTYLVETFLRAEDPCRACALDLIAALAAAIEVTN